MAPVLSRLAEPADPAQKSGQKIKTRPNKPRFYVEIALRSTIWHPELLKIGEMGPF